MTDFRLTTPVAFIIFNRPETTEQVFNEIAKAQPPKLLVVGDGPRASRPGEAERVAITRAIIGRVNWPCEVLVNFSETNLGCKIRVSSGLDWVFENVPEAIILEDDCIPDPSFFRFCQELLDRYRTDTRVGMISGDNFQLGRSYNRDSYYFSKYLHIWGWATWRDRWVGSYDVEMSSWPKIKNDGQLTDWLSDPKEAAYWASIFEKVYLGKIDTWDYQWAFANWSKKRVGILPSINLISNIGFGPQATHTTRKNLLANLPINHINFPLIHPLEIIKNESADKFTKNNWFMLPLWKKVLRYISALTLK
jgi:hypothetical protein